MRDSSFASLRTACGSSDAQVKGHINPISSRIAGTVQSVYVENDPPVKAGQPLIDLEPKGLLAPA